MNGDMKQRKCIYYYNNCVKDEFHFLLLCPLYDIFCKNTLMTDDMEHKFSNAYNMILNITFQ